ncbi:mRNA (2'-O-methyladenosine-N(6)-)-methyltransferase, partial [Goodea atripinnis]
NASPESRKVVKWNAEDTMNWLRRDHSASKEDYMDRLEHLRQQCGPHVTAVAKDSVEGICSKIYQLSAEYSRRLRQTHLSLLQDPSTVRLAIPTPALPRVELHFENDVACLRFKGEMVKVNRGHFSKLVSSVLERRVRLVVKTLIQEDKIFNLLDFRMGPVSLCGSLQENGILFKGYPVLVELEKALYKLEPPVWAGLCKGCPLSLIVFVGFMDRISRVFGNLSVSSV